MKITDETTRVWTTLVSTSRELVEQAEADLKGAGLPPLSWYDALLEIEDAGEDGIRPFILRERLLLPQYGTSRLLDRIARAGLIERRICDEDGRGQVIFITPEGRGTRQKMWPIYAKMLEGQIQDKLTAKEATTLADLLDKIRPAV